MNEKNNEYSYEKYWHPEVDRVHNRYYEKLYDRIKSRISPEKGLKILDVGGGNGEFLNYLGIKNAFIFDISGSGLEIAKEKFNFDTIKGDIRGNFPFKDESFDFIYCCEVLEHLEDDIKMILWDMAQVDYLRKSSELAESIQAELNTLLRTKDRGVKQAPFKVITGVACPAVLVEVAFISNPEEERKLGTAEFQQKVAQAIYDGLADFLRKNE